MNRAMDTSDQRQRKVGLHVQDRGCCSASGDRKQRTGA